MSQANMEVVRRGFRQIQPSKSHPDRAMPRGRRATRMWFDGSTKEIRMSLAVFVSGESWGA